MSANIHTVLVRIYKKGRKATLNDQNSINPPLLSHDNTPHVLKPIGKPKKFANQDLNKINEYVLSLSRHKYNTADLYFVIIPNKGRPSKAHLATETKNNNIT